MAIPPISTQRAALRVPGGFFLDNEFGGVYWLVDHLGRPIDRRKRIYARPSPSMRSLSITTLPATRRYS